MKSQKHHSQFIRVQPIFGAEPLMCSMNVEKRIRAMGGRAVYGWAVRHDKYNDAWQNHCVWESPDGELVDVTPVFSEIVGDRAVISWPDQTEFVRDEAAVFTDRGLPTRYVPSVPGTHMAKACEYMTVADGHLRNGDLEKCRYWTERANRYGRKVGIVWDTPASTGLADTLTTALAV